MGRTIRLGAPIVLSACSLLTDLDGYTSGAVAGAGADAGPSEGLLDAGSPTSLDGGVDGGGDAEARGPRCRGTQGPQPVNVGGYCIDATEVRRLDYDAFLAAKAGDTSGQPADCSWNTTYEPLYGSDGPNWPVLGIDWCDAFMYCRWAGKRLCGRIGGGTTPPAIVTNALGDEWHRACTNGGTRAFPYGDTYEDGRCNTAGLESDAVDVASYPRCEGGYPGLFDMAGNSWEWSDNCDGAGADGTCYLRGQAFASNHNGMCRFTFEQRRDGDGQADISFRCCSDLE